MSQPYIRYQDRKIEMMLNNAPKGILLKEFSLNLENGSPYAVLEANEKCVKPGLKGNLIFNTVMTYTRKNKQRPKSKGRLITSVIATTPAVPFEITPLLK